MDDKFSSIETLLSQLVEDCAIVATDRVGDMGNRDLVELLTASVNALEKLRKIRGLEQTPTQVVEVRETARKLGISSQEKVVSLLQGTNPPV